VERFKKPILDLCSEGKNRLWFQQGTLVLPGVDEELCPMLLVQRSRRGDVKSGDSFVMHVPEPEGGGSEAQRAQQALIPRLMSGVFLCLLGAQQAVAAVDVEPAAVADSCTMVLQFGSLESCGRGKAVRKVKLTWRADSTAAPSVEEVVC